MTPRHSVAYTSAVAGSHHEHTRRGHQVSITGTLGRPLSASGDIACLAAGSEGNEGGNGAGEQTHPSIMSRVPTPPHGSGRGEGGGTPERVLFPASIPRPVTPRHSVADPFRACGYPTCEPPWLGCLFGFLPHERSDLIRLFFLSFCTNQIPKIYLIRHFLFLTASKSSFRHRSHE